MRTPSPPPHYMPHVSIIMPCHNAQMHLPASFGSVMAQTFPDWEIVAVDDGSTDTTLAWLRTQTDPRVKVITQPKLGVSAARNAGIGHASGNYLAFLDADDTWTPDFLEKMVAALAARPDAVLAYCGWWRAGPAGRLGAPFVPPDYETPAKQETLFGGCRWPVHAALVRRTAVQATKGFDLRLENAEDFAFWLELAPTAPIIRVPHALAFYHFHGGVQASANRARAALHHLQAQLDYLERHPDFAATIGRRKARKLLYGDLLERGYEAYWKRDLPAARQIFRRLVRAAYGGWRDLKYLVPALLPLSLYRTLIGRMDKNPP